MSYEKEYYKVMTSNCRHINGGPAYYVGIRDGVYSSLEIFEKEEDAQALCDRMNRELAECYEKTYNCDRVRAAISAVNEIIRNMSDDDLCRHITECQESALFDIIDIAIAIQEDDY
jgi:hypothetical protein